MKRKLKSLIILSLLLVLSVMIQTTMALIITEPQSIKNTFKPFSFPLNDLIVSKTIEHPFGENYEIPENLYFDFQIDFGIDYANYTFDTSKGELTTDENGIINVKLRHGETIKVENVDEGTKVKVTEVQNQPGFTIKDVAVSKDGTISSDETLVIDYTNVYKPEKLIPELITVTGTKILEGREWQENDVFAFTLEFQSETGEWITLATKSTIYNAENPEYNKFDFSDIMQNLEFNKIGTYNFRLTEVIGSLDNVDYDETINYFNIEITDKTMDGKLEIDDVKGYQNIIVTKQEEVENSYNIDVTFNNKYEVEEIENLNVDVSGTVKVDNTGELEIGPENFEIILANTQSSEEIKLITDTEGKVNFDLIFTKDDIGKTFEYTIKQTNDGKENVTYSTEEYLVQITITLNENNELVPVITINGVETDKIDVEFTNIYHANPIVLPDDISVDVEISKVVNNTGKESITPENFEFILKDTTTKEEQTVKTDKNGKANIRLEYTHEDIDKTFKYTLKEVDTKVEGVTYSDKTYNIEVVITLSEDNKLIPTIKVDEQLVEEIVTEFTNTYNIDPPEDISVDIEINKTIDNIGDAIIGPYGFEFVLENTTTKETQKVKVDENGKAIITLDYTSEDIDKTYYYTLKEVNTGIDGVTYSTFIYDIKTVITLSEDNKLIATTTVNNKKVDEVVASFENIYEKYIIEDITVDVNINNKVDNTGKYSIGPENFNFILVNQETGDGYTAITDENGLANIKLTFTESDIGKTYKYKLSVVEGNIPGLTYSADTYDIEIAISLNSNHKLVATMTVNGQVLGEIITNFLNVYYVAPETPALPPTLDVSDNTVYVRTLIITAGGLMLVLLLQSTQNNQQCFATAIHTTRIVPETNYEEPVLKAKRSRKQKMAMSSDDIYDMIVAKRKKKATK